MKTFNLTEKRIEVLRWLARKTVPQYVCAIMDQCLTRPMMMAGHQLRYTHQQATRAGAGYARALAEAGLILVKNQTYGWGTVEISPEGRAVLAAFDRDDGTLQERLTEARTIGPGRCWWLRRG